MGVVCLFCEGAVTPTTPSVKCGSCKKYGHIRCLKLNESEIAEIISNQSPWLCPKCSPPYTSVITDKIEEIMKKQLSILQQDLKQYIDNSLKSINDRLITVENKVSLIQEEWAAFKTSHPVSNINHCDLDFNSIAAEIEDRKLRSSNVLLSNVPESTASSVAQKIEDDLQQISTILSPLGSFPNPKKVVRIGSFRPNSARPLKIVCESEIDAKNILRSNKANSNRNNHFRPDLTRFQRDFNNNVRDEFKKRLSNGEADIDLQYKNNQAFIVKKGTSRTTFPKK
ncbi:hypothetical protein Zmor_014753 [Zophobas morio]|uniref:PHD-type domain-containing protein n=1 Tax=Zophobas morio TaxID=2755281 RepID=A0AA38IKS2_9CUCU|nr:hypothetical protein Zmor_014753 [Zophobas morio]